MEAMQVKMECNYAVADKILRHFAVMLNPDNPTRHLMLIEMALGIQAQKQMTNNLIIC